MNTEQTASSPLTLEIPNIQNRHYWVVRTDKGTYFTDFTTNGYISIGWDYISSDKIRSDSKSKLPEESLRRLISVRENLPIDDIPVDDDDIDSEKSKEITKNRREVSRIMHKVSAFVNDIQVGDIVIIPSMYGKEIAIGEVASPVYEDPDYVEHFYNSDSFTMEYTPCPFFKRIKVDWLKKIQKEGLDIYLQNALKPQQAIFPLDDYANYINRNIYDIYQVDNEIHSIFHTFQNGNLSLSQLKAFTDILYDSIQILNDSQNGDAVISPDDIHIKLNIHSPGIIEVISGGALSVVAIGSLISGIWVLKHGGKLKIGKNLLEFETKGSEEIKLRNRELDLQQQASDRENRKLDIVEKLIANRSNDSIGAISSLNLKLPFEEILEDIEENNNDE